LKTTIIKIFVALILICGLLIGGLKIYQKKVYEYNNLQAENIQKNKEDKLAEETLQKKQPDYVKNAFISAIMEYYNIKQPSDILFQDSKNPLGYIQFSQNNWGVDANLAPDPNLGTDITLHFMNMSDTTNITKAHDLAVFCMQKFGKTISGLNTITVTYSYGISDKENSYYKETSTREDLNSSEITIDQIRLK
jgi:hypothetical protein